jgi:hypothetical protein
MSINWSNLFVVAFTSIGAALLVVALFSVGVRLLTDARIAERNAKKGDDKAARVEAISRTFSYIAFSLCGSALLYGIYLIVPAFHLSK